MGSTIVAVSGASSGIGEATAKLYARQGAHVLLLARNEERLGRVAKDIRAAGGTASPFAIDLSQAGPVADLCDRIKHEIGTPDILINNAGAGRWLPLVETSPAEARAMIEVPYLAAFYLTRAFLPEMIASRRGQIACITSPASFITWPNACAYIAARHALAGFTQALQSEVRGTGVTATLIVLGVVESSYWEHNPGSRERMPHMPPSLFPTFSVDRAAAIIVEAIASRKPLVVKPFTYRAMFLLNVLVPRLVASEIRRAARRCR